MFRRLTLSAILGVLILTGASCAEEKKEEAPAPATAAKAAEPEGPYYELTKDDITSHADWTSKNITYKGVKLGDKSKNFDEKVGKFVGTDPIGGNYRAVGEGTKFAIYTQKMTGELGIIEIYSVGAEQVADPKLKKLLTSGDLDYLHKEFGMEDSLDFNPDTTAMEWSYNSKGFKFAKYDLKGVKMNAIQFAKVVKKAAADAAKK
jgi:hypothetical protein